MRSSSIAPTESSDSMDAAHPKRTGEGRSAVAILDVKLSGKRARQAGDWHPSSEELESPRRQAVQASQWARPEDLSQNGYGEVVSLMQALRACRRAA